MGERGSLQLWSARIRSGDSEGAFLSALSDFGNTIYDLVIPHYGNYGGAGYGFPHPWQYATPGPLNQVDDANLYHDWRCGLGSCESGLWASDTFTGSPTSLPAGPCGMAYQLIGLVPFAIAGAFGK